MADTSYSPGIYRKLGGNELVVAAAGTLTVETGGTVNASGGANIASGGVLTVASGGKLTVASGGILADATGNLPASVSFTPAAGAANVCEVTVTVKDAAGATLAAPFLLDLWLSDAATGIGLTGTTASGAVAAKAASGQDMGVLTTKKALRIQTLATGIYVLSITDTSKTGFFVAAQVPGTCRSSVSAQLVTGNYG